jgi:epsilon-lactone hydrolase
VAPDIRLEESPLGPLLRPAVARGGVVVFVPPSPDASSTMESTVEAAARLAELTGASVVCPRYRCAFPAAFEDVQAAYRQIKPLGPVSLVGERMGAGLAAALLVWLRDLGAAPPRCAVLVSALLDLTMRANSLQLHARTDVALDVSRLRQFVASYAGAAPLTNPLVSPLYANLHGLPPVQLQVAGTDPLLDDSLSFAARAARSGVAVELRVAPDATGLGAAMVQTAAEFIARADPAVRPAYAPTTTPHAA